MEFFSIQNTFFYCIGYPISYIEFIGSILGFAFVVLATLNNLYAWPVGILSVIVLFFLFFQVQLYADLFLQVYYLITSIYGWMYWKRNTQEVGITYLKSKSLIAIITLIFILSIFMGYFITNIHIYLPQIFIKPAALPYSDSVILITSIAAQWLLANRKIENWILWTVVNIISCVVYYQKQIYFLSLEYAIFFIISFYGYFRWRKGIAKSNLSSSL
jgi:nicotinamide mononucleotide transporter